MQPRSQPCLFSALSLWFVQVFKPIYCPSDRRRGSYLSGHLPGSPSATLGSTSMMTIHSPTPPIFSKGRFDDRDCATLAIPYSFYAMLIILTTLLSMRVYLALCLTAAIYGRFCSHRQLSLPCIVNQIIIHIHFLGRFLSVAAKEEAPSLEQFLLHCAFLSLL